MAMNSPSGPTEATRNAGMMSSVMAARDREKNHDELEQRERDRLEQEQLARDTAAELNRPGFFQRLKNLLPFG